MLRLLGILYLTTLLAGAADTHGPSKFYVVAASFSDHGGLFYYRVAAVRQDGPDSVVRYIRVAPGNVYCPRNMVQAVEKRVRGKSPAQLVGVNNPCAIDSKALNAALHKPATNHGVFETTSFGIVASCGGATVSLRLPIPEQIDLTSLKSTHPAMARLWTLNHEITSVAFGETDPFDVPSEAENLALQQAGASQVQELISGSFDQGLREARSGDLGEPVNVTFRDLLAGYQGPIPKSEARGYDDPKLEHAEAFRFRQYSTPPYPPLALQARISGKVDLRLTMNPQTGEVQDADATWGHPLLAQSAIKAAKLWRLEPGSVKGTTLDVTITYTLRCSR
ncbi:MAG: energy transducer TonB [Paludibaculum sp.]